MTVRELLAERGRLEERVDLARLTTYKLGGPARFLVTAAHEEDVVLAGRLAAEETLPIVALGRGSNVVVSDHGFEGVVVRPGVEMSRWSLEDDVVAAGCGMPLPLLARESASAGRGGLEFLTGIPGSVGGAVRMNAGCHGSETAEWLIEARVVVLSSGEGSVRTPSDMEMSYRNSNLTDDDFVVSAQFRTVERDREEAEATIREIARWRREHQPGGTLNAGSVFKNPPGDAAGRIIDSLGLKGLGRGAVSVSERHANFFVAGEGATAQDMYDLVEEVRARVRDGAGIDLEPEVRFMGDFAG